MQTISDRFSLLAKYPRIGRQRPDLFPEVRAFASTDYVIIYSVENDGAGEETVQIHYVFHGSRDIESFFRQGPL